MIHSLKALREQKDLILDICEIFVKEPLLDWVKEAKKM
jgi:phosphatidylinositol kinase/protein kinase (PI-3  family)